MYVILRLCNSWIATKFEFVKLIVFSGRINITDKPEKNLKSAFYNIFEFSNMK